jgi:ferrous iron transport protein A
MLANSMAWRLISKILSAKYPYNLENYCKILVTNGKLMGKNNDLENEQNQESKPGRWGEFTFLGGTPTTSEASESCAEISVELNPAKSFPLAMAGVGDRLKITKLKGSEGMVKRLIGMGFVAGCEVQIISTNGGSVIVALADNRIGLGVGMAQKIMCTNT